MKNKLLEILPRLQDRKVLVVGDIMLDEHILSKVSRISPEAPVPVADVVSIVYTPGGAANVATNIQALGGSPYLLGAVGKDSSKERLFQTLRERGINTDNIIVDEGKPTTLKSRIIAHGQHVVRVDTEKRGPISNRLSCKLLQMAKDIIDEVDALIISDYGKGVVTYDVAYCLITMARERGKVVSIDPKGSDYGKYTEATIITPTQREAEMASKTVIINAVDLIKVGWKLLEEFKTKFILITKGEKGMSLFEREGQITHIPAVASEVYDVTGAGDTVISVLTLALAAGAKIKEAAQLSNLAAGIVVRKVGTAVATRGELEEIIRYQSGERANGKIRPLSELISVSKRLKDEGKKVVFTNGCFDLLHIGHLRYLQKAKEAGDVLIVGINSDSSMRRLKGTERPIVQQNERAEILSALECVDYVVIFSEDTPYRVIRAIVPDILVKGGDYEVGQIVGTDLVKASGGEVLVIDEVKNHSTALLVKAILDKYNHGNGHRVEI